MTNPSIFSHLPPDDVMKAVLSETQAPLEEVQRMSGFLIDPSAGFLTSHQKEIAYSIYQNSQQLIYIVEELQKYVDGRASAPSEP